MTDATAPAGIVPPIIFLVGFVIMSLSSIVIYARGSKEPSIRKHVYFHSAVPFIAATSYLAMFLASLGMAGVITTSDGVSTFVARYVDWTFTTPILLAGLVLAGLHEHGRAAGFLVAIIVLDVLMILTGLFSSLSPVAVPKLAWYLWSCSAFLGVLYILWGPVRAISVAEGGPMTRAYQSNLVFLTVIWFVYPVVFALAPEGLKVISAAASATAILVIDVIAKVVYAFTAAANIEKAHGAR